MSRPTEKSVAVDLGGRARPSPAHLSAGLCAVVLAAGAARRFGGAKMLADFHGRPLATWAVQSALDAGVHRVVVVTAPGDAALEGALRSAFAPALAEGRLALSACPDAYEGLGASLRHGVAACCAASEGVFVFLGDMPAIPPQVAPALVRALRAGAEVAAPVWRGQRGHPVLFTGRLRPALLRAGGDNGMQVLLAALGAGLVTVEAPGDGVLFDIDTCETLALRTAGVVDASAASGDPAS